MDGLGLFNTINSYNGIMNIGFICDRYMMPDPEFYTQCIKDSFRELERAACPEAESRPKKATRKKAPANKAVTTSSAKRPSPEKPAAANNSVSATNH